MTAYLRWAADVNIGCPVLEKKLTLVIDKLMTLNLGKKTPPA